MKSTIITLSILALLVVFIGNAGLQHYFIGMEYDREIGGYFEYADRTSSAEKKAEYFNNYVNALKENGLDTGYSSVFWTEQPEASLSDNFEVAVSLQDRLNKLANMSHESDGYQDGMRQVTMQEFCWFPENVFKQAYYLSNGHWGIALTPTEPYDRCYVPRD